ncbi:MAG: phthalate 4,5-dioxygenase [Chloroflexi bacterium]|nr:phthalate 4,5-dioxygenase [Chloroflexota bacterium]
MTTSEENALLIQTGPGTPCGELHRRYWQPVALSQELPPGGAPLTVRLLSEDLVLFRADGGRPALLGLHCAHRGADLSYGRIEDGGLRCIYHGWLYDVNGRCLEQPGEPSSSTFHERIRHRAYPCQEVGGIIYTYMGPGEPTRLPPFEFVRIAPENRDNMKSFADCNYLQGNEGNLDPVHLSFLHQLTIDEPESGRAYNAQCRQPAIETEDTEFGVRIYAVRSVSGERNYVRVTNFILPNFSAVTGNTDGYTVNWHVPIDDEHHWRYFIRFSRTQPLGQGNWWRGSSKSLTPDLHLKKNRANRYGQDRSSFDQAFAGLGPDFLLHDTCAVEGPGPIEDRAEEHLAYTDRGIVASRAALLQAIRDVQEGRDPKGVARGPSAQPDLVVRSDALLPASVDWRHYWDDESLVPELTSAGHG